MLFCNKPATFLVDSLYTTMVANQRLTPDIGSGMFLWDTVYKNRWIKG